MKKKFYSLHGDAIDSNGEKHIVTVVGELICDHVTKHIEWDADVTVDADKDKIIPGKITFNKKVLHRKLTIGTAICSPKDEFDEAVGIKIAKSRIRKGEDAGILETNSVTMLTEDGVYAILLNKLKWISDHIDLYITDDDEDDDEITIEIEENAEENTPEDPETTLEDDETNDMDNSLAEGEEADTEQKNALDENEDSEGEDEPKSLFDTIPAFEEFRKEFRKMHEAWLGAYNEAPKCCSSKKKCKKCDKLTDVDKEIEDFIFGY